MKWLKNFLLATLPSVLIILVLLELIFRFVMPAAEVARGYYYEQEQLYTYDTANRDGQYTLGKFGQVRAHWHINNMTWNSAVDYDSNARSPLIAVIGDSFIEAFQVDTGKSYPDLLRRDLRPAYEVYAFGKSGSPLSQYLHISRYVKRHFHPKILVINIVLNDFDESLRSEHPEYPYFLQVETDSSGRLTEALPRSSPGLIQNHPVKKLLLHSALARYCVYNLKIAETWKNLRAENETQYEENIRISNIEKLKPKVYRSTDFLLKKFREENPGIPVLFVMDGQRNAIYKNTTSSEYINWMYSMMHELTAKYQLDLLDLNDAMRAEYQHSHRPFNTPLDGHLDEYGHAFVARQVLTFLKSKYLSAPPDSLMTH